MSRYDDGMTVSPCSRSDLRRAARSIRAAIGVADSEPFPVMHFLECILPVLFHDFSLRVKTREEMGDKHGETFPNKRTIVIREDVYLGACAGNGRDLFTVVHEIGHLFLHAGDYAFAHKKSGGTPIYRNSEWQADAFAGELLMPYEVVRLMDAYQVHEVYGVTITAARTQLRAIGR